MNTPKKDLAECYRLTFFVKMYGKEDCECFFFVRYMIKRKANRFKMTRGYANDDRIDFVCNIHVMFWLKQNDA